MMTLDAVRAAVLSDLPWSRLDELVRAEMALGRKTKQIYDDLIGLADEIDDTPGLTEKGSDAFGDTLDALTGMCHPDCQYYDPPNTTLPTEEEIAELPRWARVAFAARCARRVLSLFTYSWPAAPEYHVGSVGNDVQVAETAAATAKSPGVDDDTVDAAGGAHSAGVPIARSVARSATRARQAAQRADSPYNSYPAAEPLQAAEAATEAAPNAQPLIRRDFDHLANLAQWQHWTDDTPVPPEVFGPLWPEGPPAGWPADPDVPRRADLPLALVSAARVLERMTEDETVNLFNAINAYYVTRTGDRLTIEDLRPLLAAGVFAGV